MCFKLLSGTRWKRSNLQRSEVNNMVTKKNEFHLNIVNIHELKLKIRYISNIFPIKGTTLFLKAYFSVMLYL